MELQSVLFETEDVISRPDPEPILTEMIHQVTVWLMCPEQSRVIILYQGTLLSEDTRLSI